MENSTVCIPVMLNGTVGGMKFENEVVYVNETEIAQLLQLGFNPSDETNQFGAIETLDDQIRVLFTLHKVTDAWNLIKANIESIDYIEISKCPFFHLDRMATDVFKYLYTNSKISDADYAYFNVISGKFFDTDFMYSYLGGCKTATEVFDMIYGAFNGINPQEVGWVEYTKELRDIVEAALQPNEEIVNYVIGSAATIEFTANDMLWFMMNDHIREDAIPLICRCIFERGNVIAEENVLNTMWQFILDREDYYDIIQKFRFDNLEFLKSYIEAADLYATSKSTECKTIMDTPEFEEYEALGKFITDRDEYHDSVCLFIVVLTSEAFANYPHTVLELLEATNIGQDFAELDYEDVARLIPADKMMYYYLVTQTQMFKSLDSAFIASSTYPQAYHLVFNMFTKKAIAGGINQDGSPNFKVFDLTTDCEAFDEELGWAYEAKDKPMREDIFARCNSETEYYEVAKAICEAYCRIIAFLNDTPDQAPDSDEE